VGLNLTLEVRDGISKHSKGRGEIFPQEKEERPSTLEGQVVRIADIIAYINHDIDDAIRGGVISPKDIPLDCLSRLGETHSKRINTMVNDLVSETRRRNQGELSISEEVLLAIIRLRDFLWDRVYENEKVHEDFTKLVRS